MSDVVDRLNAALEGRYRIERELGEGGMATVYLADDLRHERKVALKVLKPELAAVVGGDRFLTEIKTTANLQHPHILPLFDSGEADSFLFYVMPYIEGETLRELLEREKQLPVDEAVRIATAVANALHTAHQAGIVHRDIKPGNILLSRGEPLVADFGIALAVGSAGGSRLTETGLSVGTPYYMSPEQATGDQAVGAASDTYALACVLYEMLVGDPPYQGSTAQAVLGKIIQGEPVSARSARKSVPPNVDAAIRKALEKIPADRFADARGFAQALSDPAFRHGEPRTAAGAGAGSRWNALTLALAALVVLLGAHSGWVLLQPEVRPAVERFGTPFLEGQEPLGTGGGNFILSEDGSMVVYVGRGQDGGIQLWVRRWDDLQATPIRGTEGGRAPRVSPDGTEVAFDRGGEIHVVPLAGGPVRTLMPGIVPMWGDDGYVYARLGAVGSVRVPAGGGAPDTISRLSGQDQNHFVADVLPGSRKALLMVISASGDQEIRVLDLESGEESFLVTAEWARYVDSGHLLYPFEGTLIAAPFDPREAEITGDAVTIESGVLAYTVARNGRLLYSTGISGGPNRRLVWITRDGAISPVDSTWTFTRGDDNLSWRISPDGNRLVLREMTDGTYDIWVKELPDGPRSRLTFDEAGDYYPQWTPDGQSITYVSGTPTGLNVYTRRADGTGEPTELLDAEESIAMAFWSPDREWLILRSTTGAGNVFGRDILAMRPGVDDAPRPLMAEEFDEMDPTLSPDGRWIAYASNETGRFEVYVRPFPNVESGRWQVSNRGGSRPVWSRNGRELFFGDENDNMVVAQVDGSGTAFVASSPRILFATPSDIDTGDLGLPYDVSPDGQRFMMAQVVRDAVTEASGLPDFVLVQNFAEILKERVPR
ncbi:MAG: protein kinase [Longimicrobiales bacterium]|nr:protein kinase [Longimicrobiales bacterium]